MFMSTIGNNMPSLLKTIVIAEVNRGCPYHFKDWFLPPDTTHTLKTNVHMVFNKKKLCARCTKTRHQCKTNNCQGLNVVRKEDLSDKDYISYTGLGWKMFIICLKILHLEASKQRWLYICATFKRIFGQVLILKNSVFGDHFMYITSITFGKFYSQQSISVQHVTREELKSYCCVSFWNFWAER